MLAVADIPMLGMRFRGVIGVILIEGREYRIATYLGAKVIYVGNNKVIVRQGKNILEAELLESGEHSLNAPQKGRMVRTVHESVACKARYRFIRNGRTMLNFVSEKASFEYEMTYGNNFRNHFWQK